jgi:hypothetical protein
LAVADGKMMFDIFTKDCEWHWDNPNLGLAMVKNMRDWNNEENLGYSYVVTEYLMRLWIR